MEVKRIGNLYGEDRGTGFAGNVWDKNQLCPTITTMQGGGREPMIVEDFYANREPRAYDKIAPTIRAEREGLKVIEDAKTTRGADVVSTIRASYYKTGERNIRENIVSGKGYEGVIEETKCLAVRYRKYLHRQRGEEENPPHVELAEDGLTNSLTTVQKDNLVMETPRYRIRKLTPRECWRLMGYTDEDFDRAAAVNSQTQLYKQAGNAIVKQVLMAIFLQMNIQGLKPWNDRNEDEIRELIK